MIELTVPLEQEQEFLQKQQQDLDSALKKIIQQHKHELATVERDCLNHKQQLLRGKTALKWRQALIPDWRRFVLWEIAEFIEEGPGLQLQDDQMVPFHQFGNQFQNDTDCSRFVSLFFSLSLSISLSFTLSFFDPRSLSHLTSLCIFLFFLS